MTTSNEMLIAVLDVLGLGENAHIRPTEEGIRGFHGMLSKFFPNTETKVVIKNNCFQVIGEDFIIIYVINEERIKNCSIVKKEADNVGNEIPDWCSVGKHVLLGGEEYLIECLPTKDYVHLGEVIIENIKTHQLHFEKWEKLTPCT